MKSIVLGRIVKPVGIRGELKLQESPDFWDGALQSKKLRLMQGPDSRQVCVVRARVHRKGMRILTLEGIEDRNAAEDLVGAELTLDREGLDVEEPEDVLPFQLEGVEVFLPEGDRLGMVEDLLKLPVNDVIVVRGETKEYLIPYVPGIVEELDLEAKRMRIRPLPGLLEL